MEKEYHYVNLTSYAMSIGYTGKEKVLVENGKVMSHCGIDWFTFCDLCREGKKIETASPYIKYNRGEDI